LVGAGWNPALGLGVILFRFIEAVSTWAQDDHPDDLQMAQTNAPLSKAGQFPSTRVVRGGQEMQGDHTGCMFGCFDLAALGGCHIRLKCLLVFTCTLERFLGVVAFAFAGVTCGA
jgi:hypothetical protein